MTSPTMAWSLAIVTICIITHTLSFGVTNQPFLIQPMYIGFKPYKEQKRLRTRYAGVLIQAMTIRR
jgi:hypothetical protein